MRNETYTILKRTPYPYNFRAIERGLDLDWAQFLLEEIYKMYAEDPDSDPPSLLDTGMELQVYEGGDLHEYVIQKEEPFVYE